MIAKLDENNLLMAYAVVGELSGNTVELKHYDTTIDDETGEEAHTPTGLIPEDFESKFRPFFFKFDGEKIVLNENFEESEEPAIEGTNILESLQQENLELKLAIAELAEFVMGGK